ncbi:cytochrome-c peroxidase [bacterium]|nr:MAG: cytochrome-c peroxidase [bacterium]
MNNIVTNLKLPAVYKLIHLLRTGICLLLFISFSLPFSAQAESYSLQPLPPLPIFPENPITPDKVELGKKLFFDRRLSGDGTMSCATCHNPETGYSDALSISLSYPTTKNWRHSPSLINLGYNSMFFWDGRASTLEEQALFPMMSAFEMNQNLDYVEEELKEVPVYIDSFQRVFGGEITRERIAMALAAFQKTIVSKDAPIDSYLKGDMNALTNIQKKGYDIFVGKGKCINCHNGSNLTDNNFYNLGVPEDPDITNNPRVSATRRFTAKVAGYKAYRTLAEDPGRYLVTKDRKDWKAFKTPTLREVVRTGPYMHNGYFETVEDVIEFFDKGGGNDPNKTSILKPLHLSSEEKNALKVFLLEALKGDLLIVRMPEVP